MCDISTWNNIEFLLFDTGIGGFGNFLLLTTKTSTSGKRQQVHGLHMQVMYTFDNDRFKGWLRNMTFNIGGGRVGPLLFCTSNGYPVSSLDSSNLTRRFPKWVVVLPVAEES
jgi:hypothetical protein